MKNHNNNRAARGDWGERRRKTRTCRARQGAPKVFTRTGLHPITTGNDFPVSTIRDFRQSPFWRGRILSIYIDFGQICLNSRILSCLISTDHSSDFGYPPIWIFDMGSRDRDFSQILSSSSSSIYVVESYEKSFVTHHPTKVRLRRDNFGSIVGAKSTWVFSADFSERAQFFGVFFMRAKRACWKKITTLGGKSGRHPLCEKTLKPT